MNFVGGLVYWCVDLMRVTLFSRVPFLVTKGVPTRSCIQDALFDRLCGHGILNGMEKGISSDTFSPVLTPKARDPVDLSSRAAAGPSGMKPCSALLTIREGADES